MAGDIESKIVRSEKITIEQAVSGMVVAEPVKNETGGIVLAQDSMLTRDVIEKLKSQGIETIYIQKYVAPKKFTALTDKKVVVVSEALFIRHMFAKLFYRMGMLVCDELEKYSDVVRTALKTQPDMILIDIDSKEGKGIEFLTALHRKFPESRKIAVSSSKEKEVIISALKSGANDYMIKPVQWNDLQQRVLRLFETPASEKH